MVMDWDKLIFSLAVAGIGAYAVYAKDGITAGVCLGIMGAILRPGTSQKQGDASPPEPAGQDPAMKGV
jgi:hypothetical protein